MFDYQRAAFSWVVTQGGITGLMLMALGVVYAFLGFRFFRFLLFMTCAGFGAFFGLVLARVIGAQEMPIVLGCAVAGGLMALVRQHPAVVFGCGATFAVLGHYLSMQVGLPPKASLVGGVVAGSAGAVLAHFSRKSMPVVMTTLNGTALMITGFVGATDVAIPSLSETFRSWANNSAYVVPIMLLMLSVAGYSVQACALRGDIRTGRI